MNISINCIYTELYIILKCTEVSHLGQAKVFNYRPQRSWGKVIFSQASVILLTGGHAWLLRGGVCVVAPGGGGRAWYTTRYGDTINERAVRILLECILVVIKFQTMLQIRIKKQLLIRRFWRKQVVNCAKL